MKELDSFTVERLEEIASGNLGHHPALNDTIVLARIALAAKRAKAAATADNERLKRAIEEAQKEIDSMQETIDYVHRRRVTWKDRYLFAEKKIKEIMTVDTTPQLNSPEIPEGWKLVPNMPTLAMLSVLGLTGSFESMLGRYADMLYVAPEKTL
ncbi:Uncharacterised protein [Yersinia pseudotuberculosis]|uniref:hypothetical protein n=1 Tax=Yersinia pseudotuberculosis TaxID=633 RepID=UPI0005E6CCCB|nr:hypothetical protein [Yersinia pseudotuberculosis]CNH75301.1 Uncharacterised protein [Yersinia pseudotuberculosis]CNL19949.1 Uncharacterised protein [Yersinia pseudotuberculosis]